MNTKPPATQATNTTQPSPLLKPGATEVSDTVMIPAGHFQIMTSQPRYSPDWLPQIVTNYCNAITIAIRYHAGDYDAKPPAGQSLADSLRPFKEAAELWKSPVKKNAVPVDFVIPAEHWHELVSCAAAIGVAPHDLIRVALAERVRLWKSRYPARILACRMERTRAERQAAPVVIPFHHRPRVTV